MKAYFVRKAASREVVGLFVASSTTLLAALVDECCDPTICEYAPARMGGLMVPVVTKATWPLSRTDLESGIATGLENAIPSQQWEDDLASADSGLEWKSLKSAALRLVQTLGRAPAAQKEQL